MGKEEEEKGAPLVQEPPFIPFSGGTKCQLSHDKLAVSPSKPEPPRIPSTSHLTDPARADQCDLKATVQLIEREASPGG